MEAPILSKFDFSRPFILDVDRYVKGVSAILSQKDGRIEMVVVYASKKIIWCSKEVSSYGGRMLWSGMGNELHFWQYLHQT